MLKFAVSKLDGALREQNYAVSEHDLSSPPYSASSLESADTTKSGRLNILQLQKVDVLVLSNLSDASGLRRFGAAGLSTSSIRNEGFQILRLKANDTPMLCVLAKDERGAMYGVLDLAEQVRMQGELERVEPKTSNPRFPFRAVKFNLPWSPYRSGPATDIHLDACRDLKFWERFLDMMAENRFNVLSLWNLHPFTFMIRPENFPEACPFTNEELKEWQHFWRPLFRMAKERGIETYIVNWNIVVSPEFAKAHSVKEKNDTSEIVRRYTRECVTQAINEYEDLAGLGVTLADWMNNMTPKEREDWIEETFVAGMKKAKRPVKFIHRSVLAGSPSEMRRVIDNAKLPDPVWVEIKFNWSHGHSTPRLAITHDYNSGKIDEAFWSPTPTNYKIVWMIRNEDFFILRWGEPGFIRDHIAANGHDYVGGYFVGSEGYIPARDYSHPLHPHQTWQYAFEKQWPFYTFWGRLLYDPQTPDSVFEAECGRRYGRGIGKQMLQAYRLAGRMPLRLASFHAATWDYTLYSEGFLAPAKSRGLSDGVSPFISIDELIDHQVLDPTYLSIPDSVELALAGKEIPNDRVTPLQLADRSEKDGRDLSSLVLALRSAAGPYPGAYDCEMDDLETWAYLSLYFADKLRAGVALATFRLTGRVEEQENAVRLLEQTAKHWDGAVAVTKKHYLETPHVSGGTFSWEKYRDQVQRDIRLATEAKPRGKE